MYKSRTKFILHSLFYGTDYFDHFIAVTDNRFSRFFRQVTCFAEQSEPIKCLSGFLISDTDFGMKILIRLSSMRFFHIRTYGCSRTKNLLKKHKLFTFFTKVVGKFYNPYRKRKTFFDSNIFLVQTQPEFNI